jgi:deazaflavin-dependent oxidoreductase (nitroreductase family)
MSDGDSKESQYKQPDISLLGADHIAAYRETGGEVGYLWNGVPTLLLTTTGRRSGEPRTSALIFATDGDDYLVVASMGGAPQHPQWYLNVDANPEAQIQVKADVIDVVARTAGPDEKQRLWQIVAGVWPNYDVYQTRTDRDIPVVVLSPRRR